MKYYKELLIAILIVAFFWSVFDGQLQRKKLSEFDKQEEIYKAKFDSLQQLQYKADVEAILALTDLEVARNQLREQSKVTEKYKIRYNVLKSMAPPNLSDSAINAAVARLYPGR